MTLFRAGPYTLHSGEHASWKVDCDALTPDDYVALVEMALDVLPAFSRVVGVPRGGLAFADALRRHANPSYGPTLIVDDVYTTGASMEAACVSDAIGLVIFARRPPPSWIHALWVSGT